MRSLELTDKDGKVVEVEWYDTSGQDENCLLNALFGNSSEGSAITIHEEGRAKKMRKEIRKFLENGYHELLKESNLIEDSIISKYYKDLEWSLDKGEQIGDLVNDGEQLLTNLIPIIMLLSGIEKVTLYIVDNGSAELSDTEKTNKEEYELPSLMFDQVSKKEEVWGDLNAKEHTIFCYCRHYSRAKVINQEKLVSIGKSSAESTSHNNQNDKKPSTGGDDAVKVNSSNNTNCNQPDSYSGTLTQETTQLQANNNQGEDKKALPRDPSIYNDQVMGQPNETSNLQTEPEDNKETDTQSLQGKSDDQSIDGLNSNTQTKPKPTSSTYAIGIGCGMVIGAAIAYLSGAAALTPAIAAVAVFIAAAVVGALVGYGIGKLCEKVSGQFSDASATGHDPNKIASCL